MNEVKRKLANGELTIGTMIFESNTPGIAPIIAAAGAEFALYDMEHTGIGIESVRQLMSYNRGVDIVPIVRVPSAEYTYMARVLDVGAKGIMVPFVNTKEQAEQVVKATKYYPLGERGVVFGLAHDDFTGGPIAEKMKEKNDDTLIIVQIETEEAMENLEAIASTEGIDVLFIGSIDLSQSMGIPGELDHPRIVAAMERVVEVCDKYGKAAGCIVMTPKAAADWIKKGYRFVSISGDVWLLQYALKKSIKEIKEQL